MNAKNWLVMHLTAVCLLISIIAGLVVYVDPYFHYHKPLSDKFAYPLSGVRTINHGILKHFDYDAMIIGTSMTENFRSSELDELFGVSSVKVPFFGATYKEISTNIAHAINSNPELKLVVCGLDYDMLFYTHDELRTDLGKYPEYLYDNNIFNDVEYVFNRSVFDLVCKILSYYFNDFPSGVASFDEYSRWDIGVSFGPNSVSMVGVHNNPRIDALEEQAIRENIHANVTALAKANPQIDFYYFFTPYSAAWWQSKLESGQIQKVFQAEQIAVEEILKCENIKLLSLTDDADVCTDLNHYKDPTHYAPWINSLILKLMRDERCILTEDNYLQRLEAQRSLYTNFDYNSLLTQEDYEDDLLAQELIFTKYGY